MMKIIIVTQYFDLACPIFFQIFKLKFTKIKTSILILYSLLLVMGTRLSSNAIKSHYCFDVEFKFYYVCQTKRVLFQC